MKVKSIFTLEGELGALSDKALLARAEDEGLGYWDLRVRAKWVARLRRRLGKPGFTQTCRLPENLDLGFWLRTVLVGAMAKALYGRQPKTFVPAGTKVQVIKIDTWVVTREHPVKQDLVPAFEDKYPAYRVWSSTGCSHSTHKVFQHSGRLIVVPRSALRDAAED